MLLGGLQKFSVLDFPGHLSAIVFTQGCNFRCHFCYNPRLVMPETEVASLLKEGDLFSFLEARTGKLDAVVITGGEPTMHHDLESFIDRIRSMGFKIKLDTNGTNPDTLKSLIGESKLDYVAMDVKAALGKYDLVIGVQPNLEDIKKSIKIIIESGLDHEFRTTVVPELISLEDIREIGEDIRGAKKWFLQGFKSDVDLINPAFKGEKPFSKKDLEKMKVVGSKFVDRCEIR